MASPDETRLFFHWRKKILHRDFALDIVPIRIVVRTVVEPAKDKLLADRDNEEVQAMLPKVGISVVQDETFYVEPKKEE